MKHASIISIASPSISLARAKSWLRVDGTDEDDSITELIAEAYSEAERRTGRLLREATAELTMDSLPRRRQELAVPFAPLRSVTSFSYFDTNGVASSLTPHICMGYLPGLLLPPTGECWPETQPENAAAVTIRFECGAVPTETQKELEGCIKMMLDLAYSDLEPQEQRRLEARRDAILRRWSLRDSRLDGLTYV